MQSPKSCIRRMEALPARRRAAWPRFGSALRAVSSHRGAGSLCGRGSRCGGAGRARDLCWIDFGHLPNTRDLGGLAAAEGSRVKPGLLLRSGALGFGSDADLRRLRDEYHLMLVVDLRNDEELIEIPDPMDAFPGARYVHADILARSATGITQEKATREKIARERREFERSMRDDSDDNMEIMYATCL